MQTIPILLSKSILHFNPEEACTVYPHSTLEKNAETPKNVDLNSKRSPNIC